MASVWQTKTDEELADLTRTTDKEAYGVLVKRYQKKLHRYAMTFVSDTDVAWDIVQTSLLKGFTHLHDFNTKQKFSSWIYRISHNQAIDYIRKHKREVTVADQHWLFERQVDMTAESIEERLEKKLTSQQLHRCLNLLPLTYRSPISLYFFENKSYQEISQILRVPMGTVATRLNRGKQVLEEICHTMKVQL